MAEQVEQLAASPLDSAAAVLALVEKVALDTGADEVIVVTDTYEQSDRIASYERVAGIAVQIKLVPNVAA